MKVIDAKFDLGDIVYLKTDSDQAERMVNNLMITPYGIMYGLAKGTSESWHNDIEISVEKNILITTKE
jgi:hypothetical protein